jgi:formylglycine-generating enzyme required for sulfatase activity
MHVRLPSLALALVAICAHLLPLSARAGDEACPQGMRRFEGGTFRLGDGSATVSPRPFCLDETEVTAGSYAECVRAGGCADADLRCSRAATYGDPTRAGHPMNCVSWLEADAYCRRAMKRLPTEGEWEWAARGGARATPYPWGTAAVAARACWDGKGSALGKGGRKEPCPVGTHPDGNSPEGISDLAGNVREWTSSSEGRFRIVRGGSWGDSLPEFLSVAFRGMNAPDERFELTGFRCAADPLPTAAHAVARVTDPASSRRASPAVHQPPPRVLVLQADELRIVVRPKR